MSAVAVGVIGALIGAAGGGVAGSALGSAQTRVTMAQQLKATFEAAGGTPTVSLQAFLAQAITSLNSALTLISAAQAKASVQAAIALLTSLQQQIPTNA